MTQMELIMGGVGLVMVIFYWIFVPRPPDSHFMRDGKERDEALKREAGE